MSTEKRSDLIAKGVTDESEMDRLESDWRAIADQCPAATVFQTFEWNRSWWRHFGRGLGKRLHIVELRHPSDGRLVGLAPLMTSFWYGTLLRRISFIGGGISDYHDLLCLPGFESAAARTLYEYLSDRGGWHVADFQQVREDCILRTQPIPDTLGFWVRDYDQEACPYLNLPPTWDELSEALGKKTRSNIRYYERSLEKVYEVEFTAVSDESCLDEEMNRLFELHQRRWNARWLPGVFGSARMRRFHKDVAKRLLASGKLRLYVLHLDGFTQACLYCFAHGNRVCYYQGGFEPDLGKYSPGTVLTAMAIKDAIAGGANIWDFLRGDEPYKAKWTTNYQTNARRLIARRRTGIGPMVAAKVHQWEDSIECKVKAWAAKR